MKKNFFPLPYGVKVGGIMKMAKREGALVHTPNHWRFTEGDQWLHFIGIRYDDIVNYRIYAIMRRK